jgi:hypothetical protein
MMSPHEELDRVEYLLAQGLWEDEDERLALRELHMKLLEWKKAWRAGR